MSDRNMNDRDTNDRNMNGAGPGLLASAIERPVTVAAGVLLVILFGVLAVVDLPIQLTPDISTPTVTVNTRWPGASPVEVETEILEEQEEVLKRVQGLVRMESTASPNSGQVTLEFEVGTDLEQALVRVTNQLSQVPSYPASADQPVVETSNAAGPPLAVILVRHESGESIGPYRTWTEEEIVPELERIPGIASMFMRGGRTTEVHVEFDTEELAARRLTVPMVASRVRAQLRNASAGEMDIGKRTMLVRTRIAGDSVEELEDIVIASGEGNTPIRLRDVGTVREGLRHRSDFAIGDDRDAIALLPRREAGSNVLRVTEDLKREVARLDARYFAPEGLEMEIVSDQTGYIYEALDQVRFNLGVGALLATLTLLLFLRSFAASAIVALAIPLCALGTAMGMAALGRSVNVVSLAGVTFAVGMVVDNSIVALENIDTWRRKSPTASRAALSGIREVWGALLASTATTAAIFIPILTWQGEVGELLRDIAYAIAIAVIISLVVSVLVIPSFAAKLLKPKPEEGTTPNNRALAAVLARAAAVRSGITDSIRWLAERWWRCAATVAAGVVGALAVAALLLPKMEYLPTGNRNLIFGIVLPPPGYSIEELRKVGFENQAEMMRHTGKRVDGWPAVHRSFFVGDSARLFIGGVAENPEEVGELKGKMRALHARIPGTIGFATQAALFSRGIGEGRAVEVELTGNDLNQLVSVGRELFGKLSQLIPGSQVRPQPLLDFGAPELRVVPKRSDAAAMGFTPNDIALVTDAYVDGAILGEFGKEGERKVDVVLKSMPNGRGNLDDNELSESPVATPTGETVPFSVLADVETHLGPTVIQRIERRRSIVLLLTPPDEVPIETAIEKVENLVSESRADGTIPDEVRTTFGGSAGKLTVAQQQFTGILVIAVLILYLLLTGLFQDFVAPIVVLIAVPLASAGGVLGLSAVDAFLTPQPLDLVTALGFLILIGVVVNNAILIVDGALARLREGDELADAVAGAVEARVRPIFMTTLTSLAGLMPMVFATGSGSELYRGIGAVVLGGLSSATLLTVFVVPGLFVLLWRMRRGTKRAAAAVAAELPIDGS